MGAAGFLVAGGLTSAAGSIFGGLSRRSAARYQAAVAQQQAQRAAELALARAAKQEELYRGTQVRRIGAARAAIGASGVTIEGSPLDVLAREAERTQEQALLIRYGGTVEAQGALYAGQTQANAYRMAGNAALWGGIMEGSATLLGTAGVVSSMGFFDKSPSLLRPGPSPYLPGEGRTW